MKPARYRVAIQPAALQDLDEIMEYIAEHSPQNAVGVMDEIISRIEGLETMPHRCELARENDHFPEELRQLHVHSYRVIYTVKDQAVHVIRIRHGARLPLDADKL